MEFIKGMDISSYQEMRDNGKIYYDAMGQQVDAIALAKKSGANYIRLRIWNDPSKVEESGGYCGFCEIIETAKKIKEQHMGFLLDFHYSDWWADPANQKKPKAWEHLSVEELKAAVYEYTKMVMETLKLHQVYPDMVQIGNEIRTGMLFPEGAVPNWKNLALFLNAGISAVRDVADVPKIKVMIHLDQGGKYAYFKEWFDEIIKNGVTDFDVIGLSYYPFWHGTYEAFKNTMEQLVIRYEKELIVAETAYPYRRSKGSFFGEAQERAGGFLASEENQKKVMDMVFCITANVSKKKGIGIFYWEPFTYGGEDENGWGNYMGFVKEDGTLTQGILSYQSDPYAMPKNEVAKIYLPMVFENQPKEEVETMMAKVLYMDGTTKKVPIGLDGTYDVTKEESFVYVNGERLTLKKEQLAEGENLVKNPEFFQNDQSWEIYMDNDVTIKKEENEGLFFQGRTNFQLSVSQKIINLQKGIYQPYLLYEGENTTGVEISFFVKTKDEEKEVSVFPDTEKEAYFKTEQLEIKNENEEITVGVNIQSPPVWGKIRKISFIQLS